MSGQQGERPMDSLNAADSLAARRAPDARPQRRARRHTRDYLFLSLLLAAAGEIVLLLVTPVWVQWALIFVWGTTFGVCTLALFRAWVSRR